MNFRWKVAQFFEINWWRFYLAKKDKPYYLDQKKLYWIRILKLCEHLFTVAQQASIIDLGCGPSGLYILYPSENMTAVDPLLLQYERQLKVFSRADYPFVNFVQSTIEDFETVEQFEYVFCMNAINHVSDIKKGFEKIAKLAADGAKVVVSIDAHNYNLLKVIFRLFQGDVLHPHQYDKAEYISFMENQGLRIVGDICIEKHFIFNHYMLVAEKTATH